MMGDEISSGLDSSQRSQTAQLRAAGGCVAAIVAASSDRWQTRRQAAGAADAVSHAWSVTNHLEASGLVQLFGNTRAASSNHVAVSRALHRLGKSRLRMVGKFETNTGFNSTMVRFIVCPRVRSSAGGEVVRRGGAAYGFFTHWRGHSI